MSSPSLGKNPDRVAAGLKATVNRRNVSDEAKKRALKRLEEMGIDVNASVLKPRTAENTLHKHPQAQHGNRGIPRNEAQPEARGSVSGYPNTTVGSGVQLPSEDGLGEEIDEMVFGVSSSSTPAEDL